MMAALSLSLRAHASGGFVMNEAIQGGPVSALNFKGLIFPPILIEKKGKRQIFSTQYMLLSLQFFY